MREPMVTRTIITTQCNVLCLNLETAEPFNKEVTLPRTYSDEKKLFKMVQQIIDSDTEKAVHIVDTMTIETLYGMTEADFIANADVLPPRGTKVTETDETTKKRGKK